jgi:hypothetical protein
MAGVVTGPSLDTQEVSTEQGFSLEKMVRWKLSGSS